VAEQLTPQTPHDGNEETTMDEAPAPTLTEPTEAVPAATEPVAPARRTPDPLTLVAGVIALAVSAIALTGWTPQISFDPRWVLAGGAVLLGVLLLVSSMRRPR